MKRFFLVVAPGSERVQQRVLPVLANRAANDFFRDQPDVHTGNIGGLAGADATVNGSLMPSAGQVVLARLSERRA